VRPEILATELVTKNILEVQRISKHRGVNIEGEENLMEFGSGKGLGSKEEMFRKGS